MRQENSALSTWRGLLRAGFLVLCARYQLAVIHAAGPELSELLLFICGSFLMGVTCSYAAIFAFSIAMPLLMGLGQIGFLTSVSLPTLVFSALWTGTMTRVVIDYIGIHFASATDSIEATADRIEREEDRLNVPATDRVIAMSARSRDPYVDVITQALISAVFLSLLWQLMDFPVDGGSLLPFTGSSTYAYGDPRYFITSAFVWLQGLFYFEALFSVRSLDSRYLWNRWSRIAFIVYVITMVFFALIQYKYHIPEGWTHAGLQSPFDDISSFGSVSAAAFIYFCATVGVKGWGTITADTIGCLCSLVMLSASWSRGAWLAGLLFLALIVVLRFPRKYIAAFAAAICAILMLINVNANNARWANQPYLARVLALFRFENPENKDSGRLHLYAKARNMIIEHPLLGHGVGSFYRKSILYASPNDTSERVKTPDFAHNVLLQLAAEEGVIVAALFGGLIGYILWRGMRSWSLDRTARNSEASSLALATTLALACYVQTQMTANSLNVYVSNQYFFWFLMAGILAISGRKSNQVSRDRG